jgi:hypothetical protein
MPGKCLSSFLRILFLSTEFVDSMDDAGVAIEPVGDLRLKGFADRQRVSRVAVGG